MTLLGITLTHPINIFAEVNHASIIETETRSLNNFADQVEPQKDIIRWKFKTINGQIYKRQYNHSKAKWIGAWQIA